MDSLHKCQTFNQVFGRDRVFLGNIQGGPQSVGSCIQVMMSIRICPLWNKGLWVQELKTSEQPRLDPKVHASPGVSL